jgi:hypothetical protein
MKRSIVLLMTLLVAVALCSLSLPQEGPKQQQHPKPQNLKVLPKDISHEELDKVMDGFKKSLGVKCGFCHAPRKDNPQKLDFASDDNEHKDVARAMMRMTAKINKKYFKGNQPMAITCYTCHHGNEEPKSVPEMADAH